MRRLRIYIINRYIGAVIGAKISANFAHMHIQNAIILGRLYKNASKRDKHVHLR